MCRMEIDRYLGRGGTALEAGRPCCGGCRQAVLSDWMPQMPVLTYGVMPYGFMAYIVMAYIVMGVDQPSVVSETLAFTDAMSAVALLHVSHIETSPARRSS